MREKINQRNEEQNKFIGNKKRSKSFGVDLGEHSSECNKEHLRSNSECFIERNKFAVRRSQFRKR